MKTSVLRNTALILGLALLVGSAPAGEKTVIMKVGATTPAKNDLGEYRGLLKYAELVEKYSDGSIKCEVYPANQLGTTIEMLEGTSMGTIESCTIGTDVIATLSPSMNVLSMPFIFRSEEHQTAVMETPNEMRDRLYADLEKRGNLKVIGRLYRGSRVFCNSKRALFSPKDFKGLTFRSPESRANKETIQAVGAIPVTITWSEVFTSVAQKVCDGAESAITELYAINLHEVVSHVSETNHLSGIILMMANLDWFNSLSPKQQEAVMRAGKEMTDYRLGLLKEEQRNAYKAFEDKGVKVLYSKDIDNEAFREACKDVYKLFLDTFDEDLYVKIRDMKF